jgi:small subunit ribosomal protein S17
MATETKSRNTGVPVQAQPQTVCTDEHCPYHGSLTIHGRQFVGMVVSDKVPKMVTVEFDRKVFLQKYERYAKRRTKMHVHNPPCINARLGDLVRVMECRPVSKTKNKVVLEVVGREELVADILQARERAADKKEEKVVAPDAPAKKGKSKPKAEDGE